MKKFYILLLALFLVSSACQKTQFSTSTRHMKNGKVSYTNHYHSERIKFAKVHSPKNQIPAPAAQIPTSDAENLIASATNEPVILSMNENRFVSQEEVNLSPMKHNESNFGNSSPDTAKSKSQDKGTADDRFNRQVIKYKNGETKTVKIISQSKDTVMYSLITEPNIVWGVMMEQIDTIIQDSVRAKAEYTNHHSVERNKSSKGKPHKSNIKKPVAHNISTAVERIEMQNLPELEITQDNKNPITNSTDLLASASNEPIIDIMNINLINSDRSKKSPNNDYVSETIKDSIADTIKNKTPNKNLMFDPSYTHIIKFKNGNEDTVRIISHSHDGLYYHLISEPKKTKFVMLAEVDTILTDTSYSFKQREDIPKEKATNAEKKGLIFSLMGFIPVIGIPFAIIGITFGVKNLRRIGKNLTNIKRKRIAKTSVIIGIVALTCNIIFTIVFFVALASAFSSAIHGCSLGHF